MTSVDYSLPLQDFRPLAPRTVAQASSAGNSPTLHGKDSRHFLSPSHPVVSALSLSPATPRRGSFPTDLPSRKESSTAHAQTQNCAKKATVRKVHSLNYPKTSYGIPLGTPAAKDAAKSFWSMDMLKQNLSEASSCYGIPLGTPAAKEAAKSFWSAEMLQQSLEKIAQFAEQEASTDRSHSPSLSSLGSSIDSADVQTPSSLSQPHTPLHLPPITVSAPPSPRMTTMKEKSGRLKEFSPPPLYIRRRSGGIVSLPSSLQSSPHLSPVNSSIRSAPAFLTPGPARKIHSPKHALKTSLSVEGKKFIMSTRRSDRLLPMRKSSSCNSFHPRSASAEFCGGTLSPDDGFHECY